MPSPILARADALMQRRRPNAADADDVPVLTDAVETDAADADDDIPVLLDIEALAPLLPAEAIEPPEPAPPLPAAEPALPEALLPTAAAGASSAPVHLEQPAVPRPDMSREAIAREIARRVEQRLATELPHLIAATIRDYLAESDLPTDDAAR
ncbi:MAG TPA: hypothetical protein VF096_08810 [Azonexus sp.]